MVAMNKLMSISKRVYPMGISAVNLTPVGFACTERGHST
jgi:hypothetical protein